MRNIIFILTALLCACEDHDSVHLIDDFYSYQSQDEIIKLSPNVKFSGTKSGLSKGQVSYNHLSEDGELGFLFFEDQLVSVGFYPNDTTDYFKKFEAQVGKLVKGKSISKGGIRIYKGFDIEMGSIGGSFVSWSDSTLIVYYEDKIW